MGHVQRCPIPFGAHRSVCVSAIVRSLPQPIKCEDASKPKLLHLFSGPSDRADGFRHHLDSFGWEAEEIDVANVRNGLGTLADHDLNSDALWQRLLIRAQSREFAFVWFGTPCSTWSAFRGVGPGPRPLRSETELYGLSSPSPPFTGQELEQLKQGTAYALRSFLLARAMHAVGGGFAIENPEPRAGHPSLFKLPEFATLQQTTGCQTVDFDQCRFGADTAKPTRIAYSVGGSPEPAP